MDTGTYRAFGLTISSDIPLPELQPIQAGAADCAFRMAVGAAPIDRSEPEWVHRSLRADAEAAESNRPARASDQHRAPGDILPCAAALFHFGAAQKIVDFNFPQPANAGISVEQLEHRAGQQRRRRAWTAGRGPSLAALTPGAFCTPQPCCLTAWSLLQGEKMLFRARNCTILRAGHGLSRAT